MAQPDIDSGRALLAPHGGDTTRDVRLKARDGVIESVHAAIDIAPGGRRMLAMPALVNAHDHGRGLHHLAFGARDELFETWRAALYAQPRIDPYLNAALAFGRLAQAGVGSTLCVYSSILVDRLVQDAEAIARAARSGHRTHLPARGHLPQADLPGERRRGAGRKRDRRSRAGERRRRVLAIAARCAARPGHESAARRRIGRCGRPTRGHTVAWKPEAAGNCAGHRLTPARGAAGRACVGRERGRTQGYFGPADRAECSHGCDVAHRGAQHSLPVGDRGFGHRDGRGPADRHGLPDDVLADPAVRRIYFGEEHAC